MSEPNKDPVVRSPISDSLVAIAVAGVLVYLFITSTPPSKLSRDIKNISYQIDNAVITLKDGVGVNDVGPGLTGTLTTKYFGNEVAADFNNDGHEDRAFLLTQESGGSGVFYYVTAALGDDKGFTGMNAVLLGDRIAPQTTEWRNGKLIVNYADRAIGEPMTTEPSVGVSKYFKIEDGQLIEAKP